MKRNHSKACSLRNQLSSLSQACETHCSNDKWGYKYYALKFGFLCTCGNSLPEEWTRAEDTKCSIVSRSHLT